MPVLKCNVGKVVLYFFSIAMFVGEFCYLRIFYSNAYFLLGEMSYIGTRGFFYGFSGVLYFC